MLAVAVASVASPAPRAAAASPTDLFFSEYVEGIGDDRALEIFNGVEAWDVLGLDLLYTIHILADGATLPSASIPLTGTIARGDVFVIAHPAADPAILAAADQVDQALAFDGNDTIILTVGSNGQPVDSIGRVGANLGNGWGSEPTNTVDSTLRRKSTVTAGDLDPNDVFDPAAEWDGLPLGTFDGLGKHVFSLAGGTDDGVVAADVTVQAAAACIELSISSVSFGTLALGAVDQLGSPTVTVGNCSTSGETILASATDATGPGATWTLDATTAACTGQQPLGTDRYHLKLAPSGLPAVTLSTLAQQIETIAAGAGNDHKLRISTACPGSTGAGQTMTMQVTYTATP